MKKAFFTALLFLITFNSYAFEIIHPLDFSGTEKEKEQVIAYIEQNVKNTYSSMGMGDPSTSRMMEKDELRSFKQLTTTKDRQLLDNVINQYCSIGMCGYNTILMMYNEHKKASKQKLEW